LCNTIYERLRITWDLGIGQQEPKRWCPANGMKKEDEERETTSETIKSLCILFKDFELRLLFVCFSRQCNPSTETTYAIVDARRVSGVG
jgi:hypothetical protein